MDEALISIYGKDEKASVFRLDAYKSLFTEGYAILESFHENRFCRISEIPEGIEPYLVSAHFFYENRNLRVRRISDDTFRIASDFEFNGSAEVWKKTLVVRETKRVLWGKVAEGMEGVFYEERIPCLFTYPTDDPAGEEEGRMTLTITEYLDETGCILWSGFLGIEKWEKASGEKKEEKAA